MAGYFPNIIPSEKCNLCALLLNSSRSNSSASAETGSRLPIRNPEWNAGLDLFTSSYSCCSWGFLLPGISPLWKGNLLLLRPLVTKLICLDSSSFKKSPVASSNRLPNIRPEFREGRRPDWNMRTRKKKERKEIIYYEFILSIDQKYDKIHEISF